MKSGTAIGLLVGGAVLVLATAPKSGAGTPGGAARYYPNPGGALNPLNWFGGQGSGALVQPGSVFGGQTYQPAAPYRIPQNNPYATPSGGLVQNSYGQSNGAGLLTQIGYGPFYSPSSGAINLATPAWSPNSGIPAFPVSTASGGQGFDYAPVLTPGGGFIDASQLAQAPTQQAAASPAASPAYAYA